MTTIHQTPEQMNDTYEWAVNASERMNGRADAIAHVGKLVNGTYSNEQLAEIQTGNLDQADPEYVRGYSEAWQMLYNMARGVAADEVGYILP